MEHVKRLDPEKPAILHIRHTERAVLAEEDLHSPSAFSAAAAKLVSTDVGKQAAFDFGASLPTNREYTLFHTPVARTLETAEYICQGIRSSGGKAVVAGRMADSSVLDQKARSELSRRRQLRYGICAFPD